MSDVPRLARRSDFPLLARRHQGRALCYLDSAATAQKPRSVLEAVYGFYAREYATVHRGVYRLAQSATESYERCRGMVAEYICAKQTEEIIFTSGTTQALNLLAQAIRRSDKIERGGQIALSPLEHHANLLPWQILAQDVGAELIAMRFDAQGKLDLDHFAQMLSPRTQLVCISHMSNLTGNVYPIDQIAEIVRARSPAWLIVDGAQSAAHYAIDVGALDCDFYCFSGHKLYGPTGVGVLWGRYEHLERLPPPSGGGHIVESVNWNSSSYGPPPARFEPGTPPIAEVVGLMAALEYLQSLDLAASFAREVGLTRRCRAALAALPGTRCIGDSDGPIVSFVVDGVHALDLATWLDVEGICIRSGHHCAQPAMGHFGVTATARISFGLYNTAAEVDRACAAIERGIRFLT